MPGTLQRARPAPAPLPLPSGRDTSCPGGAHLGPRSDPDAPRSPPSPRLQAALSPARTGKVPSGKLGRGSWVSRSVAGVGSGRRAPGTLWAPLSPVAPGGQGRRKKFEAWGGGLGAGREGTREAERPQPGYSGNLGSPASICSAPYLVPSLPGMTREGEGKPGKAPRTSEPSNPPAPRRAPPSYLVPNRSLWLRGCASYGPQGTAASGGWPALRPDVGSREVHKGASRARPSGFAGAPALPPARRRAGRAVGGEGARGEGPRPELGRAGCVRGRSGGGDGGGAGSVSRSRRGGRARGYIHGPSAPPPRFLELLGRPSCNV